MKKYNGKNGPVNAGKITDVMPNNGDVLVDGGRTSQSAEWHRQNNPMIGDWYVLAEDGNARVMSSADFKNDYEVVPDHTISDFGTSTERQAVRDERAKAAADRPVPAGQQRVNERAKEHAAEIDARAAATPQANEERELRDRQAREAREQQEALNLRRGLTKDGTVKAAAPENREVAETEQQRRQAAEDEQRRRDAARIRP